MKIHHLLGTLIALTISGCATYKASYKSESKTVNIDKPIAHSFFLIGDAGNANLGETTTALKHFKTHLDQAPKESTALFLGDNIYPVGMPKKNKETRPLAEHRLQTQINALQEFKGKPIFIPGNHDWYLGLKGLKRQEKMVEGALGKNTFLPENGCGLDKVNITDDIILITIDSRWFIADWNNHPTINENCTIKTRKRFLDELSSLFKKNRFKNIVVAMHHPLYSNGPHGGSFSFKEHMKPLPILGTLKNTIRSHAGIQTDNFNSIYAEFVQNIENIAQEFKSNTVFVSGHEHNLQYIENNNYKQVVSGSGSKQSPALIGYGAQFTYGNHGYAVLNYYTDGSAAIFYYSANEKDGNTLLFSKEIIPPKPIKTHTDFKEYDQHKTTVVASIYDTENTDVTETHKKIWGDLNREKYGTKIQVPVLELNTVFGGLTPIRQGGGQQTNSLRLENPDGKQYVLRSMKKDGSRLMQGLFKGTIIVDFLEDLFTMSHPYAAFVIPDMADAANVYHTNPKLYYMPKQPALGVYNNRFGGELYLLEERPAGNRDDIKSFGNSKKIISSFDVMENVKESHKHQVDQEWLIRSRLFDMLIGDWDRHQDQWRWASFKTDDGKTSYRPIPRDRDQPFSKLNGILIPIFKQFFPLVKNMQSLDDNIKNIKWYNNNSRFFDALFLNELTLNDWLTQTEYIQQHVTDEVIENVIQQLPKSIYDIDGKDIISKLKLRRNNLKDIAKRYYNKLAKTVKIKGTDKDDTFIVKRLNNSETRVEIYRKKHKVYDRIFKTSETSEVQLYGLDGHDTFSISGDVDKGIIVRLIGGQDNDSYNDTSTVSGWRKKTKIYDFISKKNTLTKSKETADLRSKYYDRNTYNYRDIENNTTLISPSVGINPDDGFFFGASLTRVTRGFKKTPFASKHILKADYYSAINGFDATYSGEFTHIMGLWNLLLEARATSDNYSFNFFGWGNESVYNQQFNLDYYRVKRSEFSFTPSIIRRFREGSSLKFSTSLEAFRLLNINDRYIASLNLADSDFNRKWFYGGQVHFNHFRTDNSAFPTKGMNLNIIAGAKAKTNDFERRFGYLKGSWAIYQNLVPNRTLVLATELGSQINIGNRFEIYQAATLGGDKSLRGFNRHRFTGTKSLYHSNDLRLRLAQFKTRLMPMKIGVTGGFDYGRVWSPRTPVSNKWHSSYGGSFWLSGLDMFTANISYFQGNSNENRMAFTLGFSF